jgi:hypothetical protein
VSAGARGIRRLPVANGFKKLFSIPLDDGLLEESNQNRPLFLFSAWAKDSPMGWLNNTLVGAQSCMLRNGHFFICSSKY